MDEPFIEVYGRYAMKLLRLEQELIQTLDRHRPGHKQTFEVRHVHLHEGAQGVFGIVNQKEDGEGQDDNRKRPHAPERGTDCFAPSTAMWSTHAEGNYMPLTRGKRKNPLPDARRRGWVGRA